MAGDDLPDAPWAGGSGSSDLPDAPWAATPERKSIFGTPLPPERPSTYWGALARSYGETGEKAGTAAGHIFGHRGEKFEAPGLTGERGILTGPFHAAGALYDLASSAVEAAVAPATAAVRHFVTGPQERYTGIPAEQFEQALSVAGPGPKLMRGAAPAMPSLTGPRALMGDTGAALREARQPIEPAASGTAPTSIPVDMEQLARDVGAGPNVPPPQDMLATGRPGLDPNVRLLPAETPSAPVSPVLRDSVGAARAETIFDQLSPETIKHWVQNYREHGITPELAEARNEEMSPHETFAEINDDFAGRAGGIHAVPGQARVEIGQTLRTRHAEQPQRLQAIFNEGFGPEVNRTQWQRALEQAAQQESAPFWQQFDRMVVQPTPEIEAVLQRPAMQRALRKANETLLNRGQPIENGFPLLGEEASGNVASGAGRDLVPAGETRVPTARAFQLAKEALDDMIGAAVRSGERGDVRTYTQLKRDLDAAVAAHPNREIAQVWQTARQIYRGPMQLIDARNLGENLIRGRGGIHWSEVPSILEGMNDAQREAVRVGMRGALADIANSRGPQNLKQINLGLAGGNREIIRSVIGDEAAERLFHGLEAEHRMHFAPNRIIANSVTAERQAYRDLYAPKESGGPSAIEQGLDLVHKPGRTLLRKGIEATVERGKVARAEAEKRLRDESARILTLQGPEREAVNMEFARRATEGEGGLAAPGPTSTGRQPGATGGRIERASGGHVQKPPLKTRAQSHYSPIRGTSRQRCENCSMFREPNSCTAVGGFIAKHGKCDWWEPETRSQYMDRIGHAGGGRVNHQPTEAQKQAGNYKKRHVNVMGLDISIENEKGSTRSGIGKDGKPWSARMPAHYGYLKRAEGADGDHIDCYVGPHIRSPHVWVVDQRDADSKRFDEHKCFIGFASEQQVRRTYHAAFSDGKGPDRIGAIRKMTVDQFKDWLRDGDTTKPVARAA